MKIIKKIFPVLLVLFTFNQAFSQNIEISPYTGWMLGGKVKYYQGELKIKDGQDWGMSIGYKLRESIFGEFTYNRLSSALTNKEYGTVPEVVVNHLIIDYFQVGVLKELPVNEIIKPFGLAGLGFTVFTPRDGSWSTRTFMSGSLGGGFKIMPTEHFGIRLQARLLVPMYFSGFGIGIGGGGVSGGAYASSAIVQGDFTGGIVLAF